MMTKDQIQIVRSVFSKLAAADAAETSWTDIDEQMYFLEFLENNQLTIEAAVISNKHSQGNPRCGTDHPIEECFVPKIVEAVGYILDLYASTGNLHPNNAYILKYYIAMNQVGFIRY